MTGRFTLQNLGGSDPPFLFSHYQKLVEVYPHHYGNIMLLAPFHRLILSKPPHKAYHNRLYIYIYIFVYLDLPLVCEICPEIHPKKPTKRQNFYIFGRSRHYANLQLSAIASIKSMKKPYWPQHFFSWL